MGVAAKITNAEHTFPEHKRLPFWHRLFACGPVSEMCFRRWLRKPPWKRYEYVCALILAAAYCVLNVWIPLWAGYSRLLIVVPMGGAFFLAIAHMRKALHSKELFHLLASPMPMERIIHEYEQFLMGIGTIPFLVWAVLQFAFRAPFEAVHFGLFGILSLFILACAMLAIAIFFGWVCVFAGSRHVVDRFLSEFSRVILALVFLMIAFAAPLYFAARYLGASPSSQQPIVFLLGSAAGIAIASIASIAALLSWAVSRRRTSATKTADERIRERILGT